MDTIIELWNVPHLLTLGVLLVLLLMVGLIFKGKEEKHKKTVLLVVAFTNFALYFAKLFIPGYKENFGIKSITFETIYGALVIVTPFVLLCKSKITKDFVFYCSLIFILVTMIYPVELVGKSLEMVDVIIFYVAHILQFIVAFYMVFWNTHTLNIKRIPIVPLVFVAVLCLILANETILMECGFVPFRGSDFISGNYRNTSFIFGPTDELKELSDLIIDPIVPNIFKKVPYGAYKGMEKYIPILWLVVPSFIYLSLISLVIYFLFVKVLKKGVSF